MMATPRHLLPVLLVEDNPDDVILLRRAFRKAGLDVSLTVLEDGDEAVRYLGNAAAATCTDDSWPALVLLDWKLPLRSGAEVLCWARAQPTLAGLPIVVLTSSQEDEDIAQAYQAGATSYLRKPVEFDALVRLVDTLHLYWLRTNVPPQPGIR